MTAPTEVIQADRDAAADLGGHPHQEIMRKGEYDNHPYIQAFARHRALAEAPAPQAPTEERVCVSSTPFPCGECPACRGEPVAPDARAIIRDLIPTPLCGEAWGCPDDEKVSIVTTFGALRRARAFLGEAAA